MFADAKLDPPTRKPLGQADKGRGGLYGDDHGSHNWEAKKSLAAELSKKEATRPPVFDDKAADERKMNELYGNSKYAPVGKAQKATDNGNGDNRKDRKANHLQSSILTHQDEEVRASRGHDWRNAGDL